MKLRQEFPSWAIHSVAVIGLAAATATTLGTGLEIGGVGADDASVAYKALAMLKPELALNPAEFSSLRAFGRQFPLAHAFYQGPGAIYAVAPFVAAIDDRAKAVRWYTMFCAMSLVAFTYGLAFALSSSFACAFLCGMNVAFSPYLLTEIKQGFTQTGLTDAPLSCAALMLLILACRNRSRGAWLLSCAASGLSLGFAPQAAAPFVAWSLAVLIFRKSLSTVWRSSRRWVLWCSLTLLSLGLAPMFLANLLDNGHVLNLLARNIHVTQAGIDNTRFGQHLLLRMGHLFYLLGAGPGFAALGSAIYPGNMTPSFYLSAFLAFCCALTILNASSYGGWTNGDQRLGLLPLLYIAVIIPLSTLTLFHFDPYHLVILIPVGFAAAAAASVDGVLPASRGRSVVLAGLAAGLLVQGWQLFQFQRSKDARVEFSRRVHGIYAVQLAQWLSNQPGDSVSLCTSYGNHEFSYLLAGKMSVHEYYDDTPQLKRQSFAELETALRSDRAGYIVSEQIRGSEPQAMAEVRRLAVKYGAELVPLKRIMRPNGRVAYEVYTLRAHGRRLESSTGGPMADYARPPLAVYPLVAWLEQSPAKPVVLMCPWAPSVPTLNYLSDGRLDVRNPLAEGVPMPDQWDEIIRSGSKGYFLRGTDCDPKLEYLHLLERLCSKHGKELRVVNDFRDRDGKIAFEVYEARAPGTGSSAWTLVTELKNSVEDVLRRALLSARVVGPSPMHELEEARAAMADGRRDEALARVIEAERMRPVEAERSDIFVLYLELGAYDRAQAGLEERLSRRPRDVSLSLDLTELALKQGRLDLAQRRLSEIRPLTKEQEDRVLFLSGQLDGLMHEAAQAPPERRAAPITGTLGPER